MEKNQHTSTAFHQWRKRCSLSMKEAAEALGLSKMMITFLDRGWDSRHEPCLPRTGTRKLMSAVYRSIKLDPWPE